jgi:hypothetical protein
MDDDEKIQIGVKVSADDKSVTAGVQGNQEAITKFFDGIVPDFIKDGVGILSDQVKFWRWNNQVKIITKVQNRIESSGLDKKKIPLKVLVPIIENSSLEEDENMQNKWANMLANAATGRVAVSPNYAAILNELSPIEVSILEKIFSEVNKEQDYAKRKEYQFDASKVQAMLSISEAQIDLIIENLYRLNLLQAPAGHGIAVGPHKFALRTTKIFEFTTLGYEFVKACTWNE